MRFVDGSATEPLVGVAHGPHVSGLLDRHPGLLDYVEVAFEQLRHDPATADVQDRLPILLHSASMSVAGFVPPGEETLDAIGSWATRTRTPWIGEHLAYILADPLPGDPAASPVSLTYTVCPQLSAETVDRVLANLATLRPRFAAPIILENPPQYFHVPGSTMSVVEVVDELCAASDLGLLLDLTHFLISATNVGFDPVAELDRLPLERVVEVHVSGMRTQSGIAWDDHAEAAPAQVFDLLRRVTDRVRPRAITFEYNWAPDFPDDVLLRQVDRARGLAAVP